MTEKVYSQAEMEMQVSIARVETLLSVSRDDFLEHKIEDEKNFGELHSANRRILKHIDESPVKMMECKTALEKDLTIKMHSRFVDKNEFILFTAKFKWTMAGAILLATILGWAANFGLSLIKLSGG